MRYMGLTYCFCRSASVEELPELKKLSQLLEAQQFCTQGYKPKLVTSTRLELLLVVAD